jgi:hypothetical protein
MHQVEDNVPGIEQALDFFAFFDFALDKMVGLEKLRRTRVKDDRLQFFPGPALGLEPEQGLSDKAGAAEQDEPLFHPASW